MVSFSTSSFAKSVLCTIAIAFSASVLQTEAAHVETYLSPCALAASKDGKSIFVACSGANLIQQVDLGSRKVIATISVSLPPSGLALSSDETQLFVTGSAPESMLFIIDTASEKITGQYKIGHSSMAPVVSKDGKTLWICNRFNNNVSQFDLTTRKELRRITVQREPVAADLTRDNRFLLVANFLPTGHATDTNVAAVVSVIDTAEGRVVKELQLPNGSGSLSDIRVSPDGKFAVVTHVLSRYPLPTTQLERGWMNTNAKTIIDLEKMQILNTVLLDNVDSGAANPWGVAWSADSTTLAIAHAGTHEISLIDFSALLGKLSKLPAQSDKPSTENSYYASQVLSDVPNDLAFLVGCRQRIKLPPNNFGPRAVIITGSKICTANYFSDTLTLVDLKKPQATPETIALGPSKPMNEIRKGEFYFHDAGICFQGWQSCASCHPGDGRVDGLNWDLLNDGIGNPKNTKSMLLAHQTPPCMALGVRTNAEASVRSGIKYILFSAEPEEVAVAIDTYLKSLKPVPSPSLVKGHLSPAARKGQKLFHSAGCVDCHPKGLFTDLQSYDIGTQGPNDKPTDRFDTPSLVELWRTAPYLHDGSAATVREVITTRNPQDHHGRTSNLNSQEIDALCAYLLSL